MIMVWVEAHPEVIIDSCDDDGDEFQTDAKGFLLMIFDVVHDSTDTISMWGV